VIRRIGVEDAQLPGIGFDLVDDFTVGIAHDALSNLRRRNDTGPDSSASKPFPQG
jgi:hypothetical protein